MQSVGDTGKTNGVEIRVAQGLLERRVARHAPKAGRGPGRNRSLERGDSPAAQLPEPIAAGPPLAPEVYPQSAVDMCVEVREHPGFGQSRGIPGNLPLRLGYRLMRRASRLEAVAVPGECRVPTLMQHLKHRLLDQSVDDAWHAELPDPTIRLGDFHPFHRLRLISTVDQ